MRGKRPGGWVALAVRYYRDPKIVAVSLEARLLYLNGLCYSGEQETDGRVPTNALNALQPTYQPRSNGRNLRGVKACAVELVRVGLWEKTDDGYAVPFETWSRWQETAEQRVEGRRRQATKVARLRGSAGGTDRGTDRGTDENTGGSAPASGVGVGVGHSPTTPTPQGEREHQIWEAPTAPGWEEYTDAAGNLYVRTVTNGQAAPEPDP